MRRTLFPAWLWLIVTTVLCLWAMCGKAQASSIPLQVNYDGGSVYCHVTLNYNTVTGAITGSFERSSIGSQDGLYYIYMSDGEPTAAYPDSGSAPSGRSDLAFNNHSGPTTGTFSWNVPGDIAHGKWLVVNCYDINVSTIGGHIYGKYQIPASLDDPPTKTIHVSYNNTSGVPVKIKLMRDNGVDTPDQVGSTYTVAPGTLFGQTISGLDGSYEYSLVAYVEGYELTDGTWFEVEDGVQETTIAVPSENIVDEGGDAPPPLDLSGLVDTPQQGPAGPQTSGVWKPATDTVDTARLDKTTYREGVDKQISFLKGIKEALTDSKSASGPSTLTPGETEAEMPSVAGGFLPSAPTLFSGSFSNVHVISADLEIPSMLGSSAVSMDWTFDFEDYSTAVGIMRGVLSFVLCVSFFILCVRAVRGSSASES